MNEKLQKVLARAGFASRRELEEWIAAGRISVNGKVATLGERVGENDIIRVDGRVVQRARLAPRERRVLIYHKPLGEVCTRSDPEGRPTIFDNLPRLTNGRWVTIGRLDINTSGLLLLTNDGELANRLMHPSSEIEREYAVRVLGEISEETLGRLRSGVQLDDGEARFDSLVDGGGEGANHWYHVTLREGRNREVRRLWESQGVAVSRLTRVRYGNVTLPRSVRPGRFADLKGPDLEGLLALVGLRSEATGPSRGRHGAKRGERPRGGKAARSTRPSHAPVRNDTTSERPRRARGEDDTARPVRAPRRDDTAAERPRRARGEGDTARPVRAPRRDDTAAERPRRARGEGDTARPVRTSRRDDTAAQRPRRARAEGDTARPVRAPRRDDTAAERPRRARGEGDASRPVRTSRRDDTAAQRPRRARAEGDTARPVRAPRRDDTAAERPRRFGTEARGARTGGRPARAEGGGAYAEKPAGRSDRPARDRHRGTGPASGEPKPRKSGKLSLAADAPRAAREDDAPRKSRMVPRPRSRRPR